MMVFSESASKSKDKTVIFLPILLYLLTIGGMVQFLIVLVDYYVNKWHRMGL